MFNQINQNGGIQNNSVALAGKDPAGLNALGLRVPDGKSLLLVGGNVSMDGGRLNANGGRVELGGLAEAGSVALGIDGDNLSLGFPDNVARTSVSLTNQAGIYVEGAGGGNIAVNARNLEILGGSILSGGIGQGLGTPETVAGDITLNASGEINVAGGSIVQNLVRLGSLGNGGNITIDSGSFSLGDRARLEASTSGLGNAGNVTVQARDAVSLNNASIFSTVEEGGVGKGGNIDVNAATLSLKNGAQLLTLTREASTTQPAGQGDAGNVNINIMGAVDIAGRKNNLRSGIRSLVNTGTVGNGGNITIDSGSLSLQDDARLIASTYGLGNAGNVTVQARDAVSLDDASILSTVESGGIGKAGNIDINVTTLSLTNGTRLTASTSGQGNAGNVTVWAQDTVSLADASIFSTVEEEGVGKGGNIDINAATLLLRDDAQLVASTFGQGNAGNVTVWAQNTVSLGDASIFSTVGSGGVGKGGNIDISAATLSLIDGAQLLTNTRKASDTQPAGRGDAGNVNVKVTGAIDIAGEKNGLLSGIFSQVETGAVGNGGNITIDSGSLSLQDGTRLTASTSGQGNAGNVTVWAQNTVSLADASIFSTVEEEGVGKGGNIDINAATLLLRDGAQLVASTFGQGNAGNVTVWAQNTVSLGDASIFSTVEAGGVGKAGNIDIFATTLSLTNGARLVASTFGQGNAGNVTVQAQDTVSLGDAYIFSTVRSGGVGKAGNIDIFATTLSLTNGARLVTSTFGQGNAGNVTVQAQDTVSLADNAYIFSTVESGGIGKGGNIDISAATLSLIDGAILLTSTSEASTTQPAGQGDAGNVNVKVTGAIDIAGEKNGLLSGIRSQVAAGTVGNGGNITIDSASFSLGDRAQLVASTSGLGNAGNVKVRAQNAVTLADNAAIFSTVEAGGVGKGGNIDINAATLSLIDGAQLQTATSGASATQPVGRGNAGNVNVNVTGSVDIAGEKNGFASGIFSQVQTGTVGNGGNITIDSASFSLLDGAQLSAETLGQGNAGTIKVNAADFFTISGNNFNFNSGLFVDSQSPTGTAGDIIVTSPRVTLDNSGTVNAQSASGNGGNINLQTDLLLLRRGAEISTTAGTALTGGNGGNINIDVPSGFIIAVPSENSDITANAFTGTGGRVDIRAFGIYGIEFRESPTPLSDITASSEFGTQGTVELNTPGIDPNSGLVELPTVPVDTQLAQGCYSPGYAQNRFVITGRGGLPFNPKDILTPDASQVDWVSFKPTNNNRSLPPITSKPAISTPKRIVEATGAVLNAKGQIVLSANSSTATPRTFGQNPTQCSGS
ncbi:S-layer family protein [Nostoc flagelliforme FACHB-838]|uniref:S-layer family protein n=1 Tax=Nostoc flagelliforme FACHB-838 TaxID=2692904 RepID=A0ABR8E334_9NOSO|nr:S-layer family protein [Nostoc flagelliforme]MBD2535930.1 S-layer family protein [Nostoc flagelliforme FACHB-838]